MDRAEATGLGVATAGHLALLAALTLGFANAVRPPVTADPIEVSFVEDVAIESTAPASSEAEPAPKLAEIEGPVEPAPPPPAPEPVPEPTPQPRLVTPPPPAPAPKPVPKPAAKAVPKPTPKPVAKPVPKPVERAQPAQPAKAKAAAKPAPAKPAPAKAQPSKAPAKAAAATGRTATRTETRPTGRLAGLLSGISERDSESRATTPPAKKAGPAVQASLASEVRRQLKPHWKSPTGADVELLRTVVEVKLARDGSIVGTPRVLDQTGVNASNRSQAGLHGEQAVRAVRLAAPFRLPPDFYDAWKVIRPTFDKRLSQ